MEELFGLSLNVWVAGLLAIFLPSLAVIVVLALRDRIMVKLGLRNIPRRPGMTVLIIVGVMLSTVIMSAALGTGDTISYSIRNEALVTLGPIDELMVSARAGSGDSFGASSYISLDRFREIQKEAADLPLDGLTAQLAESAPTVSVTTSLSEGRMRVVGIAPNLMEGFGPFKLISGEEVRLENLAEGEAYINDRAADELEAEAGHDLRVIAGGDPHFFKVKGVVRRGGLAGSDSTMILTLEHAQELFDRPEQVNLIVISNRGDDLAGADLSDEVTQELRVLFSDRDVISKLQELLSDEMFLDALVVEEASLPETLQADVATLRTELQRAEVTDELVSLLGDQDVVRIVLDVLEQDEFQGIEQEAVTLFAERAEFFVFDVKHDFLGAADQAGSVITALFLFFSLFSITVGILLIFLIFVMLAAARRSEMGMARAVGAKRSHLVRMFLFEGTAYALVSAAVGVVLGLAISALIVEAVNRLIASFDAEFELTRHFQVRSIIIAYCLGMVITFATVAFSSYRVSRLNIVVAIRGLPEAMAVPIESPFTVRLMYLPRAVLRPFIFVVRGVRFLRRKRMRGLARSLGLAVLWVVVFPIWIVDVVVATFRFAWPFLLRGWLTFVIGIALTVQSAVNWERVSYFGAGVSLTVIGLGLMLRTGLKRTSMRKEARDRVAFTFMGVIMLVFWSLPMDTFDTITGELTGDFDVMFVSGIVMVAAAVWTIMYNADLLVKMLSFATGRVGKLRSVLVTAVAYPMSAKFRTGLTLAMFALVIFTLMVMSVLTESFSASFSGDLETVVGGWDIQGDVNFNTPIEDIRVAIEDEERLRIEDFEAIGGFTLVQADVRQVGAENQSWNSYGLRAADGAYLEAAEFKLKLIADGYGPTPDEVWQALMNDSSLAVVEGQILATREGGSSEFFILFEDVFYEDESMPAVEIEIRERRTGIIIPLTVIGVLDRVHETFDEFGGMLVSKAAADNAFPFPIPVTTYQFKVAEGTDMKQTAKDLEASFQENGMETVVLEDLFEQALAGFRAFINIFIAFMALGLVVGVAALGVVSTRAVVERRQQIGVLRAIGYKRRMIQFSFMLESSFIALFGTAIGVVLGLILSYNALVDIRSEEGEEALRWVVPWTQIIVIVVGTYLFALLATYLPARQASRIYPAEALRYE